MAGGPGKLASKLAPGDRVLVHVSGNESVPVTVMAVVPSVQTVQRKVLMVTVRTADGQDLHRTFGEFSTVRIAS